MSATGLDVFDRTLHTTNAWLKQIATVLGPDRQLAWRALSAVLQTLRDRLPVALAAHLGAELPLLVRGVYYDQFEPAAQPADWKLQDFAATVATRLAGGPPVNADAAIRAVFATLSTHIPRGQIAKVQDALPADLRSLWSEAEEAIVPPPDPATARSAASRPHAA